jgi:DNA polymerase elongation subunit (family B)
MASWSAKFFGEEDIYYDSLQHSTPIELHQSLHDLLNETDVVVTYNGKRFDLPWVQSGFVTYGLPPPKPFKHIDLLHVVRRQFKFPSNKLEYVVKALGIGEKMPNEGFELWKKCMAGDKEAWAIMEEYNIHDTALLEALYDRVLPYITNHPNRSIVDGLVCPSCGSTHYKKEGFATTKASRYQQYSCKDCGSWFRGNENLAPKEKYLPV